MALRAVALRLPEAALASSAAARLAGRLRLGAPSADIRVRGSVRVAERQRVLRCSSRGPQRRRLRPEGELRRPHLHHSCRQRRGFRVTVRFAREDALDLHHEPRPRRQRVCLQEGQLGVQQAEPSACGQGTHNRSGASALHNQLHLHRTYLQVWDRPQLCCQRGRGTRYHVDNLVGALPPYCHLLIRALPPHLFHFLPRPDCHCSGWHGSIWDISRWLQ